MSLSTLSSFDFIAEGSESTPGLFNRIFSKLSDNIGAMNALLPTPINVSTSTWAAIGLGANSNNSSYIRFADSSGQRSTYQMGSNVGATADGLNIYDESGQTMIVSFSKQSVRFYQNIVGPVFDTGGALTDTLNVGTFGVATDSTESRVQAAITAASDQGIHRVYVPAALYPYSASSISFIYSVQMTREGGDQIAYDVKAYGAFGDGIRSDVSAFQAAIESAGTNGVVLVPSATSHYRITSTITITGKNHLTIVGFGSGSQIRPADTTFDHFYIDRTSSYIQINSLNLVGASGDTGASGRAAIRCKTGHCTFKDNEVSAVGNGIVLSNTTFFDNGTHSAVVGNFIHDLLGIASGNGYGVYTDQPHTLVANNRFQNVPRHDVYVSGSDKGADNSVIIGNVSSGNQFQAIPIFNTAGAGQGPIHGVSIIGNSITSCAQGIGISTHANFCLIAGNSVDSFTAAAIQLDGGVLADEQPTGNVITGNVVMNAHFDQPILVTNANRNVITNNVVSANSKLYGIFITTSGSPPEFSAGNTVAGNTILEATSQSIHVDSGCIDTVVGVNYSVTAPSIANNIELSTVTNNTTPDVFNRKHIFFNNASAMTVSNFINGQDSQVIYCHFNGSTPVDVTGANAFLAGGVTYQSTQFDTLVLIKKGANWFEVTRSRN